MFNRLFPYVLPELQTRILVSLRVGDILFFRVCLKVSVELPLVVSKQLVLVVSFASFIKSLYFSCFCTKTLLELLNDAWYSLFLQQGVTSVEPFKYFLFKGSTFLLLLKIRDVFPNLGNLIFDSSFP